MKSITYWSGCDFHICYVPVHYTCYTEDPQIRSCGHNPLRRELHNGLAGHRSQAAGGGRWDVWWKLGLGWRWEGAELSESQDGHFCLFPALSLSIHLPGAESLPLTQCFSASSCFQLKSSSTGSSYSGGGGRLHTLKWSNGEILGAIVL